MTGGNINKKKMSECELHLQPSAVGCMFFRADVF